MYAYTSNHYIQKLAYLSYFSKQPLHAYIYAYTSLPFMQHHTTTTYRLFNPYCAPPRWQLKIVRGQCCFCKCYMYKSYCGCLIKQQTVHLLHICQGWEEFGFVQFSLLNRLGCRGRNGQTSRFHTLILSDRIFSSSQCRRSRLLLF